MEFRYIHHEMEPGGICVMTISRREALNALNREVLEEIATFISALPAETKVLVVRGEGAKSFVAGADIAQMAPFGERAGEEFGRFGAEVFRAIETLPIPVIAAVNGFALGGGCELAMACDIRIASDNAKFGQPEVKLGIIPGFSGTYRLAKLIGQGYAKEMIYSGRVINADEALRIGLVNHVVPQEELMDYVRALALDIAANAPLAVAAAKRLIDENYDMDIADALAAENREFGSCFATADQKEGMEAFLGKRKPTFTNS